VAGFAIRSRFAGHARRSAQTRHALRLKLDHLMGAGQSLPADIQGQPALGGAFDAADPLVEVMNRKLLLMRRKHSQTREYMEMNALRGIVKDGAGTTLYNYFTEFGLTQISVDFVLGTAGTNVQGKVREVLRAIEDNLLGEAMTSVHALVSREFFD
jgi:hypothetical protein